MTAASGCMGFGGYEKGDIVSSRKTPGDGAYVVLDKQDGRYLYAYIQKDSLSQWKWVWINTKRWEDVERFERYYTTKVAHVEVRGLLPF